MASLDHRLNPLFSIKECMSCGALYTRNCGCSKGSLEDKILVPKLPQNCATCGNPVKGLYCRPCAFVRKCLNEGWYTIHDENEILNTSESSNHNTNVVGSPQEPFVVNQDPGVNSSQIMFGNGAHIGYNCPPKALISIIRTIAIKPLMTPKTLQSVHFRTCNYGDENSFTYDSKPNSVDDSPNVFNPPPQPSMNSCEFCGNNARYDNYWQRTSICDMLAERRILQVLTIFENIEYVEASPLNSEYDSLEEVNEEQEEKEFDLEDILQIQDVILCEKFVHLERSRSYNSLPEFETFSDHTEETRSSSTTIHVNNSLPENDSFPFEIEPDQGGLISVAISDNSNNPLLELLKLESFYFDLYDDPLFPRPPPEPPDVEISLMIETDAPVINNVDELNEDDDSFTFVIRTFLPFLTYPEVSPLPSSTKSEDTIFDPDISI
ncbi:hypothetical protein Tco_1310720 [Tanacetum coccineum]